MRLSPPPVITPPLSSTSTSTSTTAPTAPHQPRPRYRPRSYSLPGESAINPPGINPRPLQLAPGAAELHISQTTESSTSSRHQNSVLPWTSSSASGTTSAEPHTSSACSAEVRQIVAAAETRKLLAGKPIAITAATAANPPKIIMRLPGGSYEEDLASGPSSSGAGLLPPSSRHPPLSASSHPTTTGTRPRSASLPSRLATRPLTLLAAHHMGVVAAARGSPKPGPPGPLQQMDTIPEGAGSPKATPPAPVVPVPSVSLSFSQSRTTPTPTIPPPEGTELESPPVPALSPPHPAVGIVTADQSETVFVLDLLGLNDDELVSASATIPYWKAYHNRLMPHRRQTTRPPAARLQPESASSSSGTHAASIASHEPPAAAAAAAAAGAVGPVTSSSTNNLSGGIASQATGEEGGAGQLSMTAAADNNVPLPTLEPTTTAAAAPLENLLDPGTGLALAHAEPAPANQQLSPVFSSTHPGSQPSSQSQGSNGHPTAPAFLQLPQPQSRPVPVSPSPDLPLFNTDSNRFMHARRLSAPSSRSQASSSRNALFSFSGTESGWSSSASYVAPLSEDPETSPAESQVPPGGESGSSSPSAIVESDRDDADPQQQGGDVDQVTDLDVPAPPQGKSGLAPPVHSVPEDGEGADGDDNGVPARGADLMARKPAPTVTLTPIPLDIAPGPAPAGNSDSPAFSPSARSDSTGPDSERFQYLAAIALQAKERRLLALQQQQQQQQHPDTPGLADDEPPSDEGGGDGGAILDGIGEEQQQQQQQHMMMVEHGPLAPIQSVSMFEPVEPRRSPVANGLTPCASQPTIVTTIRTLAEIRDGVSSTSSLPSLSAGQLLESTSRLPTLVPNAGGDGLASWKPIGGPESAAAAAAAATTTAATTVTSITRHSSCP
ncbi:hypothetical protein PAPYR_1555 [Paratrimastix pyriformis]|uniref:Uncharacterized protein n=1 Tax=Paratrimastix pyriformis TaxID=342808 RepID=A0ABQ8UTX7_9EUKA|nr:hypothetical protein PAPYR_1555 [Paratrimastix pyriformis]